jgi:hypothetical protein
LLAALLLAACSPRMEPAQRSIAEIDAVVSSAAADSATYVPGQLADVQEQLRVLEASFAAKDYAAVERRAPAVLSAAQSLAAAAAAVKGERSRELDARWAALADTVPETITAIQARIDRLGGKAARRAAGGIDLDAARSGLRSAESLWSKAQAAFATGNLPEAVTAATALDTALDQLAASLKLRRDRPAAGSG